MGKGRRTLSSDEAHYSRGTAAVKTFPNRRVGRVNRAPHLRRIFALLAIPPGVAAGANANRRGDISAGANRHATSPLGSAATPGPLEVGKQILAVAGREGIVDGTGLGGTLLGLGSRRSGGSIVEKLLQGRLAAELAEPSLDLLGGQRKLRDSPAPPGAARGSGGGGGSRRTRRRCQPPGLAAAWRPAARGGRWRRPSAGGARCPGGSDPPAGCRRRWCGGRSEPQDPDA